MFELSKKQEGKAQELHEKAIVIDAMNYAPKHLPYSEYIEGVKKGGLTAHLYGANRIGTFEGFTQFTEVSVHHLYSYVYDRPDVIFIKTVEDVKRAKREGKVAVGLGVIGLKPIESDLLLLRMLYNMGLKLAQLTYQRQNLVGAGGGESFDAGLSDFGEKVVNELNNLGILIDLSHVGVQTSLETIKLSKDPVIFSHSGIHSLCDSVRNLNDEQITTLAEKGGIVGMPAFSPLIVSTRKTPFSQPTFEDWMKHLNYVVDLVGVDHVCVGTDIDEGIPREETYREMVEAPEIWGSMTLEHVDMVYVEGLKCTADLPNVTRALVYSGYSDADILKILGDNLLQLFETVWKK